MDSNRDIWCQWLLHRRFGGNAEQMEIAMQWLYAVRDKILKHASLKEGETLLDVGCGDGLIAFGALAGTQTGKVIFSDISQDLLEHTQTIAVQMELEARSQFLQASADDLSVLSTESVDVVTTRSVLIYVAAKQKSINEFFRVLKPGGRLSIFEPINRFSYPSPAHIFMGFDVSPVIEIAQKLKSVFERLQPQDDPMLDFDERDLTVFAEKAGFGEIHLDYQANIEPPPDFISWDSLLHTAMNPKIPTLEEAMQQALTQAEAEKFSAHLRPLVEARQATRRTAIAYLWAVK